MKAVIIAAGCGSRLKDVHNGIPKTLLKINGKRIIDDIIEKLFKNGIQDIIIITGYKGDLLKLSLEKYNVNGETIRFIYNSDWRKANGYSVLFSKNLIQENEELSLVRLYYDEELTKELILKKINKALDKGLGD